MGLDSVELVMEIEEEFDIHIPDSEASKVVTAGDLRDCVLRQLAQSRRPDLEPVWVRVREIIAEQSGIATHVINPESRLVEDLHLD